MQILDFHTHIGDILRINGDALIEGHKPFRYGFDPDAPFRRFRYHGQALAEAIYRLEPMARSLARAERRRNECATLENHARQQDEAGVSLSCVMPIAPHVSFSAVAEAARRQPKLLAFGSVDFTQGAIRRQVEEQLAQGAWGFKLHPILQKVAPDGQAVHEFLKACPDGCVILMHTGISCYYAREERDCERPEYGAVEPLVHLAAAHRRLRFVAAHGGLDEYQILAQGLRELDNLYADTSFLPAARLRLFRSAAGSQRLLFASDWPYGFTRTALACLEEAFGQERRVMENILFDNGAALLLSANPDKTLLQKQKRRRTACL